MPLVLPACGERETESGSGIDFRLDPDPASMPLHNFLADSKSHSGAGVFAAMETLEDAKHLLGILGLDSDAIVFDRNQPFVAAAPSRDTNSRRYLRLRVLDRVDRQVLKQARELDWIALNTG
jgi:hypothetical protein